MMNKNPFKKGTIAYLFFKIDNFFNNPKVILSKKIGKGTFEIISIFLIPFQIAFIILRLIFEILWIVTIGLIITSFIN